MDARTPSSSARANLLPPPEPHVVSTRTSNNLSFRELLNSSAKQQQAQPTQPHAGLYSQYETAWKTLAKPPGPLATQQEETPRRQEQLLPLPEDCHSPPPGENSPTPSVHSPTSQPTAQRPRKGYQPGHFVCPFSRLRSDNPSTRLCDKVFKNRRSVRHLEAVRPGADLADEIPSTWSPRLRR
jgi:hypothetical protein